VGTGLAAALWGVHCDADVTAIRESRRGARALQQDGTGTHVRSSRAFRTIAVLLMTALPTVAIGVRGASAAVHHSCTDSWKARAGGLWSTGADWSKGSPPSAADAACITVRLPAPVVLNGRATAASLTLGGNSGSAELMLNGGALSLASASALSRTGELATEAYGGIVNMASGAVLSIRGRVEVTASLQVSGASRTRPTGLPAPPGPYTTEPAPFPTAGQ
jgi:hypothetical protein